MARRRETDSVMDRPASEANAPARPTASSSEPGAAPGSDPTTEEIAQRAYEIYQSRGGTDGQDLEDWLEAERQLRRGPQAATE
jgi:hypothetical protein